METELYDALGGETGFSAEIESGRTKTSIRLQYEAQAEVIRKQLGGLLGIQAQLQLSGRKICQLLLVDPSAWSRWCRDETQVPPHIWRALYWFFTIQEKIPGLNASYFLGRDTKSIEKTLEKRWESQELGLQLKLAELESQRAQLQSEVSNLQGRVAKMARRNATYLILNFLGLIIMIAFLLSRKAF